MARSTLLTLQQVKVQAKHIKAMLTALVQLSVGNVYADYISRLLCQIRMLLPS